MGCESKQKVIQGRTYTVTQMPPSVSIPIQAKLVQLAATLAGPMLQEARSGLADGVRLEIVGEALSAIGDVIASHMPPDELLEWTQKLTSPEYVHVDGASIDFESEFAGDDMVRLYPLIAFVLEVNYARFFSAFGLGKVAEVAKAKFQQISLSDSPPT
ncbi:MAG: hypothetical protein V3V08_05460 [Nannocystaceae bacterium]